MYCTKREENARKLASDHGSYFGHSVFPPHGTFYVGSVEELLDIGVVEPRNPAEEMPGDDANPFDVYSNDWKGVP